MIHAHLFRSILAASTLLAASVALTSCDKTISSSETLTPYVANNSDANAGSWSMIVLSGPKQIAVATPVAVTDPSYKTELASIESSQAALTTDQRAAIAYWSGGGALRWNEEMRQLVARQDLPPAPNADGSYPSPSSANPFLYPQFPSAIRPTRCEPTVTSAWHSTKL